MANSRIKVKLSAKRSNPHDMDLAISIDGVDCSDLFVTRMEFVADGEKSECYLRLDFPDFDIEIEGDDIPISAYDQERIENLRHLLAIVDKKD